MNDVIVHLDLVFGCMSVLNDYQEFDSDGLEHKLEAEA